MNALPLKLLVVEDSADDAELLLEEVILGGYLPDARVVANATELRNALADGPWDMVISDHNMPGFDSVTALAIAREVDPTLPFVIVSGCIGTEVAVEAMRAGADDYLMKDNPERLIPAIQRGLREARVRREHLAALHDLKENEARLRMLTDNVPCLVLQVVPQADGTLTIPYAGGHMDSLLGPGTEVGVNDADRLLGCFGDATEQLRAMLVSPSGPDLDWSGTLTREDGRELWVDFRARRRINEGGVPVWDGIIFDTTRQKRVETEVRDVNRRLRELAFRANTGREQERARIARELHDDLGGSLTALKIDIVWMKQRCKPCADMDKIAQMVALVDDTVHSVRRICADLHPRILDDLGLIPAIEWHLERFRERTGLDCRLTSLVKEIDADGGKGIALFRVFQEVLTNIARHASASTVDISLRLDGGRLMLEVADDGVGIDVSRLDPENSFGLLGMRERIGEVGGNMVVEDAPGGGTRVCVTVPLAGDDGDGEKEL